MTALVRQQGHGCKVDGSQRPELTLPLPAQYMRVECHRLFLHVASSILLKMAYKVLLDSNC